MTRRPNHLDQFTNIGGSSVHNPNKDKAEEPLFLGEPISGQSGSTLSISGVSGDLATITGLALMSPDSVGRFISISGSANAGNNGTFIIAEYISVSSVIIQNISAVAGDANNGSISWIEREPYTLEDDVNFSRTDRADIKGTNYYDPIPTYIRPNDTLTSVDANLTNIASKTLDAHAWIESRHLEGESVSTGNTFITITDVGNLKHADSVDTLGVPVIDGFDTGNNLAAFVEIVDADIDGYGDGANLRVLNGINAGKRIIGLTRAGSSTSPNSVEIVFYSIGLDDWSLTSISPYTWEADQTKIINVCYGYRQSLDSLNENVLRDTLIKGALSDKSGAGSGSGTTGITEGTHEGIRQLIHFIDCGPAGGFASGAFKEVLPLGNPFPTSEIWYTSAAKTEKIVELSVVRGSGQKPITETWEMYDTDGTTVIETVVDNIDYSGPFEVSRTRSIS